MAKQVGTKYRRSWPQRLFLVVGIALTGTAVFAASAVESVYESAASVNRVEIGTDVLTDRTDVPAGEPRNILLVGSTETDGLDEDSDLRISRGNELLADSIMLLRLEPDTGQAYVMSINRDVWLEKRGYRINAAYQFGTAEGLVKVVKDLLDVEIDNFMNVNFAGFQSVVDELDGVPVYFPYDTRDKGSFFETTSGCHILDGEQALKYVRSRKYEEYKNGKWVTAPGDDYARVERQRDFLVLAMNRAADKGARNPSTLKRLLDSVTSSNAIVLDTQLANGELYDIAKTFSGFEPENLQRTALPTIETTVNGASVLEIDWNKAGAILDIFRGNGNTLEPRQVTLSMEDARGDVEESTKPNTLFLNKGYKVNGSLKKLTDVQDRTVVTYSSDQRNAALMVSRELATLPTYREVSGLNHLTITLGRDYGGVLLVPWEEVDLVGTFPGLTAQSAAPTSTSSPSATASTSTTGAPTTTANSGTGATTTTPSSSSTSVTEPAPTVAPTTTSGILGQPPEGVTCT